MLGDQWSDAKGGRKDGSYAISTNLRSARLVHSPRRAVRARRQTGEISFCNEFPHKLYIAIAYLQTDVNNYLSRGWLEVETGKCYVFDTAIRVPSFYYRAESETYRDGKHRVKMEWGNDKQFAVQRRQFPVLQRREGLFGHAPRRFQQSARVRRTEPHHGHRHLHRDGRIDHHDAGAGEAEAQTGEAGRLPPRKPLSMRRRRAAQAPRARSRIRTRRAVRAATISQPSDNAGNGRDSGPRQ